jgi:hypothetical protein
MTTIGVLGGRWRGTVSPAGTIQPWDGSAALHWYVAADDRWHLPEEEATVRQSRVAGAPVVETRVRVPGGDAVQRVWCVPDAGGMTVVEVDNDSSLPFAVAFDRGDVIASRPPTTVPVFGIDLPADAIVVPVAHRATVRVALAHGARRPDALPQLPGPEQVARGWRQVLDRAGRLDGLDDLAAALDAGRAELLLGGAPDPAEDPAGFLLAIAALARLGERIDAAVPDAAAAAEAIARPRGDNVAAWRRDAALHAAAAVFAAAGEARARADVGRIIDRQGGTVALPAVAPAGDELAWAEQSLARAARGGGELLPNGVPGGRLGADFAVHALPVGPATTVSFALRWHGARPAVLWETNGEPCRLRAPALAPDWSTDAVSGEALWPPPLVRA